MDVIRELDISVRCVWAADAILGEGPVWSQDRQRLYWVDVKSQKVHWYNPDTGARSSFHLPEPVGACLPTIDGRFLCALKNGLVLARLEDGPGQGPHIVDSQAIERFGGPETGTSRNRFNDAKIDSCGRLWAGSMDDEESEPTGSLYRVNWDRSWATMDDGYIVTNGPAISADGKTLYHTDTFAGEIYAFDMAPDGNLSGKRLHICIPSEDGYPDGMTIDAEGCLWVAHFGGARLTRFDPDGNALAILRLPVANVTSCAFGGPDYDRLYITTARWALNDAALEQQPLAGGLFVAEPGCRGLPTLAFGEKSGDLQ